MRKSKQVVRKAFGAFADSVCSKLFGASEVDKAIWLKLNRVGQPGQLFRVHAVPGEKSIELCEAAFQSFLQPRRYRNVGLPQSNLSGRVIKRIERLWRLDPGKQCPKVPSISLVPETLHLSHRRFLRAATHFGWVQRTAGDEIDARSSLERSMPCPPAWEAEICSGALRNFNRSFWYRPLLWSERPQAHLLLRPAGSICAIEKLLEVVAPLAVLLHPSQNLAHGHHSLAHRIARDRTPFGRSTLDVVLGLVESILRPRLRLRS